MLVFVSLSFENLVVEGFLVFTVFHLPFTPLNNRALTFSFIGLGALNSILNSSRSGFHKSLASSNFCIRFTKSRPVFVFFFILFVIKDSFIVIVGMHSYV